MKLILRYRPMVFKWAENIQTVVLLVVVSVAWLVMAVVVLLFFTPPGWIILTLVTLRLVGVI